MDLAALQSINPVGQALLATLFTWFLTALGAGTVFFMKTVNRKLMDGMLGMAAGVMIAACFWSLLAPAIAMSEGGIMPAFSDSRLQDALGVPMTTRPPMALSRRMGKGSIMTFMPWYCQPVGNRKILDFVVAGLDRIIRPLLPARLNGPPTEVIFNQIDTGRFWVGIFNHSAKTWAGTVVLRDSFTQCGNIWREKDLLSSGGKVPVRMNPYDYAVLEFQ